MVLMRTAAGRLLRVGSSCGAASSATGTAAAAASGALWQQLSAAAGAVALTANAVAVSATAGTGAARPYWVAAAAAASAMRTQAAAAAGPREGGGRQYNTPPGEAPQAGRGLNQDGSCQSPGLGFAPPGQQALVDRNLLVDTLDTVRVCGGWGRGRCLRLMRTGGVASVSACCVVGGVTSRG